MNAVMVIGLIMLGVGTLMAVSLNKGQTENFKTQRMKSCVVLLLTIGGMSVIMFGSGSVVAAVIGMLMLAGVVWLTIYQWKSMQGKTDEEAEEAEQKSVNLIGFLVKDRMYDGATNQVIYQMRTGKTVGEDTVFKEYIYRSSMECFNVNELYIIDERVVAQYESENSMDDYYTDCFELSKVPANLFQLEDRMGSKLLKKILKEK